MIKLKELAICKRRGHNAQLLGDGWAQCKWCGTWIREVLTIEEREDAPAVVELGLMAKLEVGRKRSVKKGKK